MIDATACADSAALAWRHLSRSSAGEESGKEAADSREERADDGLSGRCSGALLQRSEIGWRNLLLLLCRRQRDLSYIYISPSRPFYHHYGMRHGRGDVIMS